LVGGGPSAMLVAIPVEPSSTVTSTGVTSSRGVSWFAAAVGERGPHADSIRVYRRAGESWLRAGLVSAGGPGGPGVLGVAALTGSSAPDFTFSDGSGADWTAFIVVADLGGRWRAVPFEAQPGLSTVIDSRQQQGHLVLGENDACGCASGPETYVWYRFNGAVFVPTTPPGPAPGCTTSAVTGAKPLLGGLPGIVPWSAADLAAQVTGTRVSCSDGWALATASRARQPVVVLFQQDGRRWLRAAVGTVAQLNSNAEVFALPFSLLRSLEARLGLRDPPPITFPSSPRPPPGYFTQSRPQATAALVPIGPGTQVVGSTVVSEHNTSWYAAAVISPSTGASASVTLHVYRWTGTTWTPQGHADFTGVHNTPSPYPQYQVNGASITGSSAPEFRLQPPFSNQRLAVINDTGGHWHASN